MSALPDFESPPVVEMALGVQFRPLHGLRGIALGPLRATWRDRYPGVQEHPPLAPALESPAGQPPGLQLAFGPVPAVRHWFLSADASEIVQLQNDRMIVNWRAVGGGGSYPRYARMRSVFEERMRELMEFTEAEAIGSVDITQAEVNYINAIDIEPTRQGSGVVSVLKAWRGTPDHHLGEPEEARVALIFPVPDVGRPPTRLYVAVDPAVGPTGRSSVFMTLTARGAPADTTLVDALRFFDGAHDHIGQSFMELTPTTMHETWGLRT